jgi:hypothetical protein
MLAYKQLKNGDFVSRHQDKGRDKDFGYKKVEL